jgi:hypothetical protein
MDRISKIPTLESASASVRTGASGLIDDLSTARRELLADRHAAYHRIVGNLISLLSDESTGTALLAGFERSWRTRSFPSFFERPLLILAALRADALEEGTRHPLHAALAAPIANPQVVTLESVATSLARDRLGVWSTLTTRRVQTNDTSRAVSWLWPAFLAGCHGMHRPLALMDLGAGAGLNLIADRLPPIWSDLATGQPLPCATDLHTVARIGFDVRPLSVQRDDDVLWMRACIWPGETERLDRFEAAVQALRAAAKAPSPPVLERLTASLIPKRLESFAANLPKSALVLANQSLLRGYLDPTERETFRQEMIDFILRQDAGRALWVELELDDARRRLPAVLIAHVRVGAAVKSLRLGRSSQHPTQIEVDTASVEELGKRLKVV